MTRGAVGLAAHCLAAATLGAALLSLGASEARADGGPHMLDRNSGTAGLSGDCAACHRAHTAQEIDLLKAPIGTLCLTCHDGAGATTNVVDGVQYVPSGTSGDHTSSVLGALRGGGFGYALIGSGEASRIIPSLPSRPASTLGKVPVLAVADRQPVTSTHGGGGTAWGNGPDGTAGAGAGPAELDCTSCHNPHGNGQYRILNTLPGEDWTALTAAGWIAPTQQVEVADIANPTGGVRNYTVLPGALASDVAALHYQPTQGDYLRLRAPWNTSLGSRDPIQTGWSGTSPTNAAANGGTPPSNATGLMTAWCVSCHTRYSGLVNADGISSAVAPQPDAIFTYRHLTMNFGCELCHVSHGSNALMVATGSSSMADPAGVVPPAIPGAGPPASPVTSGDSRLLKVDNRGICEICHDPTGTAPAGYVGPTPTPGVP